MKPLVSLPAHVPGLGFTDMTTYSMILFIHVTATLGLVLGISDEAITLLQLRSMSATANPRIPVERLPGMRIMSSVCLLTLFLSGGYLTDRLAMWQAAWPKVAVAIVLSFGALAGISGRRLSSLRMTIQSPGGGESSRMQIRPAQRSFLIVSVGLRTGLIIAAVFLMTIKPHLVASICVALGLPLICGWLSEMLGTKPQDSAPVKQSQASTN